MEQVRRLRIPRKHQGYGSDEEHTTLARLLTVFPEVVGQLGGDATSLLEEAGIRPGDCHNPSARIPVRRVGELLETAARRLECPDLGMRLAERHSVEVTMQPLDRLFRAAPTIRDAIEGCVRHVGAFNSGLIMDLGRYDRPDLNLLDFRLIDELTLFPQLMEQLLLMTHNCIIWLSAGYARSRTVWFSHNSVSPSLTYARRFNTVVKFGEPYDGIFLGDADLAARVTDCDPELFTSEARLAADRFPARRDVSTEVRQAVFRMLVQSDFCTREHVAEVLGLQERTLNRRLSKEGTSFEAIRDEVRKNLAFRYLSRTNLPLTEIAGRLGYSELAVLSRCCKRWFGSSPRQLRQKISSTKTAGAHADRRPSELVRLVA